MPPECQYAEQWCTSTPPRNSTGYQIKTGKDGVYGRDSLAEGKYRISAFTADGNLIERKEVLLMPGVETNVDFTVRNAGPPSISLQIVSPREVRFPGASPVMAMRFRRRSNGRANPLERRASRSLWTTRVLPRVHGTTGGSGTFQRPFIRSPKEPAHRRGPPAKTTLESRATAARALRKAEARIATSSGCSRWMCPRLLFLPKPNDGIWIRLFARIRWRKLNISECTAEIEDRSSIIRSWMRQACRAGGIF